MTLLFLDIETLPTNDHDVKKQIMDSISPPANYKKPESIEQWLKENRMKEFDKEHRRTALNGMYGEALSIAWLIDDGEVMSASRNAYSTSEATLLRTFFQSINNVTDKHGQRGVISQWIGHNVHFDLKFLWQRCIINNVDPGIEIPHNSKPWSKEVYCTKYEWSGEDKYSKGSSLDNISRVLGYDGKGDIDGSKVYDYFLDGRIDEIVEYNKQDVIDCYNLYKRFNFIG